MLLFITGLLLACGDKEEDTSVAEETTEETGFSEEDPVDTAEEESSR